MTPEEQRALAAYQKQRAYLKAYNRAKQRAWARLAKLHAEEFAQLFQEEREFVQLEEEER